MGDFFHSLLLVIGIALVVLGKRGGWLVIAISCAAGVFWAVMIPLLRKCGKI
jgi:hypothetical protein